MDRRRDHDQPELSCTGGTPEHGRERVPWYGVPRRARAFVRLHWSRMVMGLLLLVGFAMQAVAIAVVQELVDLSISLMEVYAELARKHLEIQLS